LAEAAVTDLDVPHTEPAVGGAVLALGGEMARKPQP